MQDPVFIGLATSAAVITVLEVWKARARWIAIAVLATVILWAAFF